MINSRVLLTEKKEDLPEFSYIKNCSFLNKVITTYNPADFRPITKFLFSLDIDVEMISAIDKGGLKFSLDENGQLKTDLVNETKIDVRILEELYKKVSSEFIKSKNNLIQKSVGYNYQMYDNGEEQFLTSLFFEFYKKHKNKFKNLIVEKLDENDVVGTQAKKLNTCIYGDKHINELKAQETSVLLSSLIGELLINSNNRKIQIVSFTITSTVYNPDNFLEMKRGILVRCREAETID